MMTETDRTLGSASRSSLTIHFINSRWDETKGPDYGRRAGGVGIEQGVKSEYRDVTLVLLPS